jgi:hypothetical protein
LRTALIVFPGEYDVSRRKQWREEPERLSCEPNVILDFSNVIPPVTETVDEAVEKKELAPLVRHAFEGAIDAVRSAQRPVPQRIAHMSAVGALN